MNRPSINVNGLRVAIEGEKNLLEVIHKAGIDLPTFCYHSDISVYGACRMCIVEVEGRGLVPACSEPAVNGMVVRTNTKQLRSMRKMIIELMLASHDQSCLTCPKSNDCHLQSIANQLGVKKVRFKHIESSEKIDLTSAGIAHNPKMCILCGDCVRVCSEIQSVGALDFAYRGADARIVKGFDQSLGDSECVNCGQCVKVCPVGALMIKTNITALLDEVCDPDKFVVAQIAPAVRVALGEYFGEKPGVLNMGKIASAMRIIGFDRVYDMCFGADFTVVEEGKEFLERYQKGQNLPIFTSCCPAWVKFAEQYYPELLGNLSTAKSPMQMFGVIGKDRLSEELNIPREKIVMVAVTPCTAKKYEIAREEFRTDGNPDVDYSITTEELAQIMKGQGINFDKLDSGGLDMPFSFASGGAVIFGSSGGVSEAVLRYAADVLEKDSARTFKEVRASKGVKIGEIAIGGSTLRLGVVSGLANAKELIEKIQRGEEHFDIVEVMACIGGCVSGGGQPIHHGAETSAERSQGLFDDDNTRQVRASSQNPFLQKLYNEHMDEEKAHTMLHTHFTSRKRF